MNTTAVATTLALLLVANGAPIIARNLLGARAAAPLDGGWCLPDGRPLLGSHKTLRGAVAAVAASAVAAPLLALDVATGAAFGALTMAGDAASSLLKRRLGAGPGDPLPGIDQIPEALLPALVLRTTLDLGAADIALVVAAFFAMEIALSRVLYRLRIRDRPQ
ncbi:MAG: CDP-archaeol synthase [Gammaproteobacteria bacterium]|nr:CDP-archaeol synthase [Gammaproteobacteria bacterium]